MILKKRIFLILYKSIFQYLPLSTFPLVGKFSKFLRSWCCQRIFLQMGTNVNIERKADFGNGFYIEIGDNSGIGHKAKVPNDIKIGKDVMMAPEVLIFKRNHLFNAKDKPMVQQGYSYPNSNFIIDDDVWIGQRVICMPGLTISKGCIIGAGTILTKNTIEYGIYGGNPSRLIGSR